VKQPNPKTTLIFGYGSLIIPESLRATVPDAKNVHPVYIRGFKRDFSLWDPTGWTATNLDLTGIPFCALDVHQIKDKGARINGITFEVDESQMPALLRREELYTPIETTAYDFYTDKSLGNCFVFSANKNNGAYDFSSAAQQRYLEECCESSKIYGDAFHREFLESTYIDSRPLSKVPELGL
jgi:cation transport regulator ChaC